MNKKIAPFGLWKSPVTPRRIASGVRIYDVGWDSDGETLVWLEGRSDRGVLVAKRRGDAPRDLTVELSVRARVGYGGGDFTVFRGDAYFVSGGRLYRQPLSHGEARPITPKFGEPASPVISPDGNWVVFVWSDGEEDCLGIVDAAGANWPRKLVAGSDFYMQPRFSPAGDSLAWVEWDHPNMPWDGTRLNLGRFGDGRVDDARRIAGDDGIAVFQPEFSPDGRYLAYVSEETGNGELYLYDIASGETRRLTEGENIILPAWGQGMRAYGFTYDGARIVFRSGEGGRDWLKMVDLGDGRITPLGERFPDYSLFGQLAPSPAENAIAFIGQASIVPPRVVTATLAPGYAPRVHRYSLPETIDPAYLSSPEPVEWTAPDGARVYGLYYPPRNRDYAGDGLPPAVVMVHGGPTSQSTAGYHAGTQFFTSRGYAVLEVNYRGSTGYGKVYREALKGKWGILDVEDVASGAEFLGASGRADGKRLVIMGGSAGGYTVLRTLTEHPGLFKAGICMYGVSDLFGLALETHKFESRYLDTLLGPLPQASAVYRDRSPLFSAERISDPIAIFQGEEDKVVPKEQSELIVSSLRARGVPHEYHLYPGEGHGFRKTETIESFYRDVERFLRRYVLFG